jgi:transposase
MTKIEIPLDIPDVEIENIEINKEGDIIITVRSTVKGTRCHKCGIKITKQVVPIFFL